MHTSIYRQDGNHLDVLEEKKYGGHAMYLLHICTRVAMHPYVFACAVTAC